MFSDYPKTRAEVASMLGVSERHLNFVLYALARDARQYKVFQVSKKSGGTRTIEAPAIALKRLQKKLANLLYEKIPMKSCAYAFCREKEKGIKGNAGKHRKKRWIVNIDFKDFFPSIHFGRVRGLFLSAPFHCTEEVATILAQLTCCDGHLAMGAPSSPVISNLICRRLDNRLLEFASERHLTYTRYADDITFSSNLAQIPDSLGIIEGDRIRLGETFCQIVDENGFVINEEKVRFATRNNRQDVTGLIVNEKINVPRHYVRQVRAMLHAWEKYGKKAAAEEHYKLYKNMQVTDPENRFGRELQGKINYIGYIKGRENEVYARFCNTLRKLEPSVKLKVRYNASSYDAVVFCEGPSDRFHLKMALQSFQEQGLYTDLHVMWYRYGQKQHISNSELKDLMLHRAKWNKPDTLEIYLFDRDDKKYLDMEQPDGVSVMHGQNIISMLLPVVSHRSSPKVCIEHFYENKDLLKKDDQGRRIYLSTDFDSSTAYCATEDVTTTQRKALRNDYEYIIDSGVYDRYERSMALSKMDFANKVDGRIPPFDNMDFSHFRPIFDRLRKEIVAYGARSLAKA